MKEPCQRNIPPATERALRRLKNLDGIGPRIAVWLIDRAMDGGFVTFDAIDAWIAAEFSVSGITAWRWRSGYEPTRAHLLAMRRRWGLPFVLFIFDEPDAEARELLAELATIERQLTALTERRAVLVARITSDVRLQASAVGDALFERLLERATPAAPLLRLWRFVAWGWSLVAARLGGR